MENIGKFNRPAFTNTANTYSIPECVAICPGRKFSAREGHEPFPRRVPPNSVWFLRYVFVPRWTGGNCLTLATWKFSGRSVSTISWSGLACWFATDERNPSRTPLKVNFFISPAYIHSSPFNTLGSNWRLLIHQTDFSFPENKLTWNQYIHENGKNKTIQKIYIYKFFFSKIYSSLSFTFPLFSFEIHHGTIPERGTHSSAHHGEKAKYCSTGFWVIKGLDSSYCGGLNPLFPFLPFLVHYTLCHRFVANINSKTRLWRNLPFPGEKG